MKDITLGQFFPGDTFIHRLDPRTKILAMMAYVVVLFAAKTAVGYLICAAFLFACIAASRISPKVVLKGLRPVLFLIVFTAVLNLIFTSGEPIFTFYFLRVTREGVETAIRMAVRITLLIAGTSMLTYTTSPIMLTDAIEKLLSPLKKIKAPVHELAMMMSIALRFIPTLVEETGKIMNAQKARGADFESGGLIKRARALVPILIPLFVSAFRRADELATAMECRLYRGGEGRTRLRALRFAGRDAAAAVMVAAFAALVLIFR